MMTTADFSEGENYNNGFAVPGLFLKAAPGSLVNTAAYIDFARNAIAALDPGVLQKIATDLGLIFVPEKEKESEVCFINSEEVRPEFKLSFAPVDLSDYILAVLHNLSSKTQLKPLLSTDRLFIAYPANVVHFWELVKLGENHRNLRD